MQIMERSLKLEKLSKPGANIWENTQDNDGNEKFKLSDIFIFKYLHLKMFKLSKSGANIWEKNYLF